MPEGQAPERIVPQSLGDYLEVMSKAVFQSDISWRVVESKWPGLREAFQGFDVEEVASFGPPELDALTNDRRVIRHRRKIEAVVHNARRMAELDEASGGFQKYLRSHHSFEETVKEMRGNFKFLGETGCYFSCTWWVKRCRPTRSGARLGRGKGRGRAWLVWGREEQMLGGHRRLDSPRGLLRWMEVVIPKAISDGDGYGHSDGLRIGGWWCSPTRPVRY